MSRWGWKNSRIIVITDNAIYNIDAKKLKRVILIDDLKGITKTVEPSKDLTTFTIHHKTGYDYNYFHAESRD